MSQAIERNGKIVSRGRWRTAAVKGVDDVLARPFRVDLRVDGSSWCHKSRRRADADLLLTYAPVTNRTQHD